MTKFLLLAVMLLVSASVFAAEGTNQDAHWSYSGRTDPDHWAKLGHSACAGKNQSPVNLTGFMEANLTPIALNYRAGGKEILNNGHTVQVNYAKGSSFQLDGKIFNLCNSIFMRQARIISRARYIRWKRTSCTLTRMAIWPLSP